MKALRILLILVFIVLPTVAFAQSRQSVLTAAVKSAFSSHVSVCGIPMGAERKVFEKELKGRGFKVKAKRDNEEDDPLYGRYHESFLIGEIAGNPVSVRLKSSCLTGMVFEAEIVFRDFIDVEEAVGFANRLIPDDVALYPVVRKEDYPTGGTALVDIVGKNKKITSYLSLPWARVFLRFYENEAKVEAKDAIGLLDVHVYELTFGHEYIATMRYFDAAAAEQARAEAGHLSF